MNDFFLSEALVGEIQRKIAYSSSTYLANDVYFKMNVIDLLLNALGKEKIQEMLVNDNSETLQNIGKNFFDRKGFLNNFYKIYPNLDIAKLNQDSLKDKQLKDFNTQEYQRFVRSMRNINVIRPEVTSLYVFLLEKTSIKNMAIRREFYKVIEHTNYKTLPDDEKIKVGDRYGTSK